MAIKASFQRFVFEPFFTHFVRGALSKLAAQLGDLVLVEFPVFHPNLLIGRTAGPLKRPQTVLDSVYRAADGSLTLVDFKTLMEARSPNYRLLNLKNLRQVVTNATLFQLMTKMRVKRVALAYITRSQTVTLVSVDLASAAAVVENAALKPLKEATHTLFNTSTRYGIRKLIKIDALEELGVTTGPDVGEVLPPWVVLPEAAPPRAPRAGRARSKSAPPRRALSARRVNASPPPAVVGAPLAEMYVAPDAAAAAVVAPAPVTAFPKQTSSETAEMRAAINERIGKKCETLFDSLTPATKAKLRGKADELFQHLARSRTLFPSERVADGTVDTMKREALNQPTRYPREYADDRLRPEVVQALIRTGQRALNALVVHEFARTRGQRAQAEVADGVTTKEFLEKVLHHSRRDLWTTQAIEWAEERVDDVLAEVEKELKAFLAI